MELNFEINEQLINETQITLTGLESELWESYMSSCGTVVNEVEAIRKEIAGEEQDAEAFENSFINLCETLWHQLSFYNASYLAVPYMMKLLDKKIKQQDFKWQLRLISEMGMIVATDVPCNHYKEDVDEQVVANYNNCIQVLAERTKQFIMQYLEQIKELDWNEKSYFYVTALAILDDRKAAYALTNLCFNEIYAVCEACDEWNEEMPEVSEGEIEEITPAESVIGKWDGRSLEDTYMWYSNFVYMLGDEEAANALSFYYGTYTCPECGKEALVMDVVKKYFEM